MPTGKLRRTRQSALAREYEVGDRVEVLETRKGRRYGPSWFPGTVEKVCDGYTYSVRFGKSASASVSRGRMRPELSPHESVLPSTLEPGAAVEAMCDGGWTPAVVVRQVTKKPAGYEVSVDGSSNKKTLKETKVLKDLRPPYNGGAGCEQQTTAGWKDACRHGSCSVKSRSQTTPSSAASLARFPGSQPLFEPLSKVEVRLDSDRFFGTWYEGKVYSFTSSRPGRPAQYTVVHSHLVDEDSCTLYESVTPSHIRPRPPLPPPTRFRLHDIVEAFHRGGWWSGIIVAVTVPGSVTVAFPITRDVISFDPCKVRLRLDYIGGNWLPSSTVIAVHPNHSVRVYNVGDKVEMVREKEDYGPSWFPAAVTKVVDSLSYIVEYVDTDQDDAGGAGEDKTEYLHWQFIRPPPESGEFHLGPGTAVEVCCNGGWSPGVVQRVVEESVFEVCIDKTEVLVSKAVEFLRPQCRWNGVDWETDAEVENDIKGNKKPACKVCRKIAGNKSRGLKRPHSPRSSLQLPYNSRTGAANKICGQQKESSLKTIYSTSDGHSNASDLACLKPSAVDPPDFRSIHDGIHNGGSQQNLDQGMTAPFVKRSDLWSLIEEMDVFKEFPQRPHFLPLQKHVLLEREGKAFGLMITFQNLVKTIRKSSITDNEQSFENINSMLAELKDNGFDVQSLQSWVNRLLEVRSNYSKHLEEESAIEAQKLRASNSLSQNDLLLVDIDKAMADLEMQLQNLRKERQWIEKDREHDQEELSKLNPVHDNVKMAVEVNKQQFHNILLEMQNK